VILCSLYPVFTRVTEVAINVVHTEWYFPGDTEYQTVAVVIAELLILLTIRVINSGVVRDYVLFVCKYIL